MQGYIASHLIVNNSPMAVRYLYLLHRQSISEATALLGYLHEFGLCSVPVDYQMAERLYSLAKDTPLALARLCFLKRHGRQFEIMISIPESVEYEKRLWMTESKLDWLLWAADMNLGSAQFCLAICYYNGIGVKKNNQMAYYWSQRAAALDVKPAMNLMGSFCVEGIPEHDYEMGYTWYTRAQDEPSALYNIATLYERGLGVETSVTKALKFFERAAQVGSIPAHNTLGIFHEQGLNGTSKPSKAVTHYTMAAEMGHPHGQFNYARCLHDGFGVKKDDQQALQWFERAAAQGHYLAQLSAAIMHELGLGCPKDLAKAQLYYEQAMENNSDEARVRLVHLMIERVSSIAKLLFTDRSKVGFGRLPNELKIQIVTKLDPHRILDEGMLQRIVDAAC
ncbi:hypothetical protein EDD86DRAFT_240931, partial [Gorgonomyces haynaldii]